MSSRLTEKFSYGVSAPTEDIALVLEIGFAETRLSRHSSIILLSVAPGDREGLPSPETLEAVEGYTLLRTDRNGWIELTTDGENLWVEVERKYGGYGVIV